MRGWGSQLGPGRGTGRTRYYRYGTTEAVPCTVTLSYYYYITVLTITMRCGDPRVLESGCLARSERTYNPNLSEKDNDRTANRRGL